MKVVILGMAKGRIEFATIRGRSGAGKRANSELDLLRLIYAAITLRAQGIKVYAYILVLSDSEGHSTKPTLDNWLKKYDAVGFVEICEKQLSDKETAMLQVEKERNATAQERRGGSALAKLAKYYAEESLHELIIHRHPDAIPAQDDEKPFQINWDACYLIPNEEDHAQS
jgi:hypothetical protein